MERDFIKWFKNLGMGFVMEYEIPADVKPSLMEYLDKNDGRIGVYVYHSHTKVGDEPLKFEGMRLGYYVRSKNPFKWNFYRTAGNH